MARPTKAEAAAIAVRRTDAINRKMAGEDYLSIGYALYADPDHNSQGVAYPQGYGSTLYTKGRPAMSDRDLIVAVCKDITEALKHRRSQLEDTIDLMRDLENARLDALTLAVLPAALGAKILIDHNGDKVVDMATGYYEAEPNLAAVDRVLKIMDRRAKLNGLDVDKLELTGAGGDALVVEVLPALIPAAMTGPTDDGT